MWRRHTLNLRFPSQDGWELWQNFMRWAQVECDCDFKLQFCAQMTEAPRSTVPRWEFATAPLLSSLPLVRVRDLVLLCVYFRKIVVELAV
jgi:hypothetical protein